MLGKLVNFLIVNETKIGSDCLKFIFNLNKRNAFVIKKLLYLFRDIITLMLQKLDKDCSTFRSHFSASFVNLEIYQR